MKDPLTWQWTTWPKWCAIVCTKCNIPQGECDCPELRPVDYYKWEISQGLRTQPKRWPWDTVEEYAVWKEVYEWEKAAVEAEAMDPTCPRCGPPDCICDQIQKRLHASQGTWITRNGARSELRISPTGKGIKRKAANPPVDGDSEVRK